MFLSICQGKQDDHRTGNSVAQQDIQQPMIAHKDVVDPDVYETFELLQFGCDTAVNSGHRRSVAEKAE